MIDRERLLASIRAGEDSELELAEVVFRGGRVAFGGGKGRAASELAEVFVSMANTRGGLVVLGARNSDRAVVGIQPDRRGAVERFVAKVAAERCEPTIVPGLDWEHLPGADGTARLVLLVRIPRSSREVHRTNEGRYLERIGTHRRLVSPDRLSRLLIGRGLAPSMEVWPARESRLDQLDRGRLVEYFRRRFADWCPPEGWPLGWVESLVPHKLATVTDAGPAPTNLGVLLFAERPEEVLPSAFVEMVAYRHDEPDGNSADSKRITGPIPRQIEAAVSYLQVSPLNAVLSVKDGGGRKDYPAYDLRALQEAVVNAVVHRDYAAPSQVIVRLFPNRIEFASPGALPNGLTPVDLYAGCMPRRRNENLAGFLRYYESRATGGAFMEARGEGFLNLVRASEGLSGRRPRLEEIGDSTKLTIYAAAPEAPGA